MAIDDLSLAAAGDQFSLAETLEMARDSCRGNAAHRDNSRHIVATRAFKGSNERLSPADVCKDDREGRTALVVFGTRHASN